VADIEAAMTPATKAVVVLHYGGYPGDVVRIAELCRQRGIKLIEDSACSVASRVDGRACGVIGDIGVWSFDSQKIMVTGDGGMLTAADPDLVERARKLAYLGLEQGSGFQQAKVSATRWWDIEVSSFSRRSIMNDLQSAIGLVQLAKLGEFVGRRRRIAEFYDREFAGVPGLLTPPPLPAGHESSYYMYWVQMPRQIRDVVAHDMYEDGIYTTFRYPALHLVDAFASSARLPNAESAVEATLCLPLHQGLSDTDAEKVVESLRAAVRRRSARTVTQVAA
jgi:dTDP-4-amino-4,6-dideoxygalactose transaminase